MKKTFSLILSALMVAGMATAASAWEKGTDYVVIEEFDADNYGAYGDSYPGSLDWDWPECTSGTLLKGTVIAGFNGESHCWSNGTDNASKAFDGDTSTFFDPFEASSASWAGVILDQAYELTEVRVMPRESWLARMKGAMVQGSNDGENWVTIIHITQEADGADYHIFTPSAVTDQAYIDAGYTDYSQYWVGSGSYTMYRYVNDGSQHGDTADIEFYGVPKEATEVTADMVSVILSSNLDNFYEDVEVTDVKSVSVDGSLEGTVIGGGGAYSDSASYACAFDNDPTTFYDPSTAGPKCFTGIKVDEPTVLTEVRVMPRLDNFPRTEGANIQGSNDGITWTTLAAYTAEDCLPASTEEAPVEQTYITKTIDGAAAYTYFRYVNDGTQHGDVAEVLFFGTAGEAAPAETTAPETEPAPVETEPETTPAETEPEATPETQPETAPETEPETVPAPAETTAPETTPAAPQTFDAGVIAAAAAIVSAAGYAVAKKRK